VLGLVVLNAQPPSQTLSEASSVLPWLFVVQCWLALALFNSQVPSDRYLLAAGAGGRAFIGGRMLAGLIVALITALLGVLYPLVAQRFARPSIGGLTVVLLADVVAVFSATSLAALFAKPMLYNRAVSVLGLAFCAILTVPVHIPGGAGAIALALQNASASHAAARLAADVAAMLAFAFAVGSICARQWRRRE
jgi:hypothetical protein